MDRPKPVLPWVRRGGTAIPVLLGLVLSDANRRRHFRRCSLRRQHINELTNTDLPNLIAATQLSELSQPLVAIAPELAGACSQTRRQPIVDKLNERLA